MDQEKLEWTPHCIDEVLIQFHEAVRLKELGMTQESSFYFLANDNDEWDDDEIPYLPKLITKEDKVKYFSDDLYAAFTVGQIKSILPKNVSLILLPKSVDYWLIFE